VTATARPQGWWPSALRPSAAAAGAVRIDATSLQPLADGSVVVRWSESRPHEQGRAAVCRAVVGPSGPDGADLAAARSTVADEGPPTLSARSVVNEYGGGAWWASGDRLFWVDGRTQRIATLEDGRERFITPAPPVSRGWRHAAGVVTPDGRALVCERETHPGAEPDRDLSEPANELAVVTLEGDRPHVVVSGADFCAEPVLSPDGAALAWLRWDHPDMPWDAAEVWAGAFGPGPDGPLTVSAPRRVAGGRAGGAAVGLDRPVAACLPRWSPDGRLWWCDDATDPWELKAAPHLGLPDEGAGDGAPAAVAVEGEVGEPRWVAGGARYGFTDDGRVVLAVARDGLDGVVVWDPASSTVVPLPGPSFTYVSHLSVLGSLVAVVGGAGALATSVWLVDLRSGEHVDLRGTEPFLDAGDISRPEPVTFPTADGEVAHGLLYRPRSSGSVGPEGARPPLVVRIHGGPTAAARAELSTSVQFWTTRGFAVLDVNYRGSTGYGRRFRDLLQGAWGVADVEDCVAGARWLAERGIVDGDRCVIRGGSAGGFTALEALCHHDDLPDAFAAACSLYGVTDLMSLVADTHKFESRYLDGLVGPLPEQARRYRDRSPLHHAERLRRPVLLLQGEDDPVVPPSQARVLRDALVANGVPHALVLFADEAHGFRRAATIVAALEAELSFYGQVLGFDPADDVTPVALAGGRPA
jgi:dipeptidyl aminopeptidase/acylaminoacyl peptidase